MQRVNKDRKDAKPSDRELLCKAILHQVPAGGGGAKDVLVLMINISPHWVVNLITYNSSLASQKNKTLGTVLYLLFATSKTILKLLMQAPSPVQYGPCLLHTSLSLIHHVPASRHNDELSFMP